MSRKPAEFTGWPASLAVMYGPYRAVVRHHVDGDTYDMMIDFGFNEYRYAPVRLLNVDTPETNRAATKAAGLAAKAFVADVMPVGSRVILFTEPDPDNFGRYLAEVQLEDGSDLGTLLVEYGLAAPYLASTGIDDPTPYAV